MNSINFCTERQIFPKMVNFLYNLVPYNWFQTTFLYEFFTIFCNECFEFASKLQPCCARHFSTKRYNNLNCHSQQVVTCLKSTIESVEKVMKFIQN